jgi:hypothetical protein
LGSGAIKSRLGTPDIFVARVIGTSMEPAIPNRGLCAFSSRVSTPYESKTVLLEDYEKSGGNRYSVKRYHTSMRLDPLKAGDPGWLHERITLESINPRYPPLEISSDHKVNVIGEFAFTIANMSHGVAATNPGGFRHKYTSRTNGL